MSNEGDSSDVLHQRHLDSVKLNSSKWRRTNLHDLIKDSDASVRNTRVYDENTLEMLSNNEKLDKKSCVKNKIQVFENKKVHKKDIKISQNKTKSRLISSGIKQKMDKLRDKKEEFKDKNDV